MIITKKTTAWRFLISDWLTENSEYSRKHQISALKYYITRFPQIVMSGSCFPIETIQFIFCNDFHGFPIAIAEMLHQRKIRLITNMETAFAILSFIKCFCKTSGSTSINLQCSFPNSSALHSFWCILESVTVDSHLSSSLERAVVAKSITEDGRNDNFLSHSWLAWLETYLELLCGVLYPLASDWKYKAEHIQFCRTIPLRPGSHQVAERKMA